MTCRPRRTLSTTANRQRMIVTNTVLKKTGADRTIAFAGYGLLASSVFTAGLTGRAGVILA